MGNRLEKKEKRVSLTGSTPRDFLGSKHKLKMGRSWASQVGMFLTIILKSMDRNREEVIKNIGMPITAG